ncbi:MAG: cyclic nucleotide-binding domain-containing protein [Desulfofustis sp.]|nr:cyclic nucleotide-binding domain-containing protein [Desulfofustis sp.]
MSPGLYWVEIPDAGLYIQCGCVEDSVKHMIRRGLITSVEKQEVACETGPNAILLSDIMLQGGHFSNLAEFPVLQMMYRQGMGIPGHPSNTGRKPLLIGSSEQISAQLEYIRRGNYGLVSMDELVDTGIDTQQADLIWNLKMEFAYGKIKDTGSLFDSVTLEEGPSEIRDGVFIRREETNRFIISYRDESVSVDLNIPVNQRYPAPYPLGFHDIRREYFGVVHSGQGDGWDINRPCMSSILVYQGKLYLIDAGPNIAYCLIALGIGINEIEGIFHTHCHDDHFAGLPTLLLSDHRIKYHAAPFVRASVFKKLSALLSIPEADFFDFFDVRDLSEGVWNDINGLEVKPLLSPHPVETTTLTFRTYWGGRYYTYAHLADIFSRESLRARTDDSDATLERYYRQVFEGYLEPVDLKKIDIGMNRVHGQAVDFELDRSNRIILAHTAAPLTSQHKEIGSSAPFGMIDVLIRTHADPLIEKAHHYLADYLAGVEDHDLKQLLNNSVVDFNPGTIILRRDRPNSFLYLLLTGTVEMINNRTGDYNVFSSGALIGENYNDDEPLNNATYRTISFVHALEIPSPSFRRFVEEHRLLVSLKQLFTRKQFLLKTWLFGEALSPRVQTRLAENLIPIELARRGEGVEQPDRDSIHVIERGVLARYHQGRVVERLGFGDFFGEDRSVFGLDYGTELVIQEPVRGFRLPAEHISDIPIIRWKLLEMHQKRIRMAGSYTLD